MTRTIMLGVTGVLTGGLLLASAAVAEPNWKASPTYATVNLATGFVPDPWTQQLSAGGSTEVGGGLAPGCRGRIHEAAPDVDLNYEAGGSHLFVHVESKVDTSLVIFGPDGRWYCNDDFASLDPVVVFHNPRSGNYNIWVGVVGDAELADAELRITEMNPLDWR
ncbi:hypothetical protein [Thioalkalivibrio sp.]|uniref:hypothetical protein n=1 Tax=Thioalkalivibrio sp. TaxID=2093813 RepID=UPI003563EBDC